MIVRAHEDDVNASALAYRVYTRIRDAHRECRPDGCALRTLWVEDVQEILNVIEAES